MKDVLLFILGLIALVAFIYVIASGPKDSGWNGYRTTLDDQ